MQKQCQIFLVCLAIFLTTASRGDAENGPLAPDDFVTLVSGRQLVQRHSDEAYSYQIWQILPDGHMTIDIVTDSTRIGDKNFGWENTDRLFCMFPLLDAGLKSCYAVSLQNGALQLDRGGEAEPLLFTIQP